MSLKDEKNQVVANVPALDQNNIPGQPLNKWLESLSEVQRKEFNELVVQLLNRSRRLPVDPDQG